MLSELNGHMIKLFIKRSVLIRTGMKRYKSNVYHLFTLSHCTPCLNVPPSPLPTVYRNQEADIKIN